jgi:cytoplasmic iron level regulating protein YaaA (DUF328/UPF0246 family)
MKFQEFIQASEQLTETLHAFSLPTRNAIRDIENRIIQSEPNQIQEWSQSQHREAIQRAKQYFDKKGIEYIAC